MPFCPIDSAEGSGEALSRDQGSGSSLPGSEGECAP